VSGTDDATKARGTNFLRGLLGALALTKRWQQVAVGVGLIGFVVAITIVDELTKWETGIAVIVSMLFFMLTTILVQLSDLKSEVTWSVFQDETEALTAQQAFLRDSSPAAVDMLEYSAASVAGIFKTIIECSRVQKVRLLVYDPRKASDVQERRIRTSLEDLHYTCADRASLDLQIRCYEDGPSLRGRLYGDRFIAIGWYTFERRPGVHSENRIWGGHNPVLVASCTDPHGVTLKEMFDRAFEYLWTEASVPLNEAVDDLGVSDEWLERVSSSGPARAPDATAARSGRFEREPAEDPASPGVLDPDSGTRADSSTQPPPVA
jgi:hypothetical protein